MTWMAWVIAAELAMAASGAWLAEEILSRVEAKKDDGADGKVDE